MSNYSNLKIQSVYDARRIAKKKLPQMAFDYFDGAALTEHGESLSRTAIRDIRLLPRVLEPSSRKDISSEILGLNPLIPFGIAPMGMCNLCHPKADYFIAKLGSKFKTPVCFSTMASSSLENTFKQANGFGWFQLYVDDDTEAGLRLAKRASDAGYDTLILTVDVPALGRRPRELRHNFRVPMWPNLAQFFDCALHPKWSLSMLLNGGSPEPANFKGMPTFRRDRPRAGADWNFLERLRKSWTGNLIVKGVLNPDDAIKIKNLGIDAIYVSGHGGRQLDSLPPPIIQLQKIRSIIGPKYPLIFDSGIRNGEDIVKAYASGANFVMLGRPVLYAIAADGDRGLKTIFDLMCKEIEVTLSQIGINKISEAGPTNLS